MQLQKTVAPFEKTNFFSKLFLDYVSDGPSGKLSGFYTYQPSAEGIKKFVSDNAYNNLNRTLLTNELLAQNHDITLSEASKKNIDSLKNKTTYTVTTGHQLCLATGPAYFIYKIISVINLCESLNKQNPSNHFVPVYWMASEDHDFEEINHINLFNKKITWATEQKGKVGTFALDGMAVFLTEIKQALGESEQAQKLELLLANAYSRNNLTAATRYLVNELFGAYGLVILDGDSKTLKQEFIAEIKKDIFESAAYKSVTSTNEKLKQQGYDAQVTPREINIFYVDKNIRERIVKEGDAFKVLNTDITFSKEEIEKLIDTETEKFSPNVVLRPMYQQKILPNAVYVGGPGELAYWLQYKAMFDEAKIAYPVLVPRNFIFYLDKNLQQKMQKLNLITQDFFTKKDKLIKSYALGQQPFSLEKEKEGLKVLYDNIRTEISKVDKTLEAASEAELQKNLKSLEMLEQKGIRSIKQKNEQTINQIETIFTRLFPNDVPQERYENFLRFCLTNSDFINDIKINTLSFIDEKKVVVLNEI
ncbi:MAG TPA: bacillithiol biosynthesis cysteine-adding enzyme BshC [Bacteroidia bacterium]|jgi:bacillithiol biosynthesis cysteine-adding enzyme BshC|nr:bacillithiol biosynthesis cysteine-adding enzyme BshC [Bacteroidia bacterium]